MPFVNRTEDAKILRKADDEEVKLMAIELTDLLEREEPDCADMLKKANNQIDRLKPFMLREAIVGSISTLLKKEEWKREQAKKERELIDQIPTTVSMSNIQPLTRVSTTFNHELVSEQTSRITSKITNEQLARIAAKTGKDIEEVRRDLTNKIWRSYSSEQ